MRRLQKLQSDVFNSTICQTKSVRCTSVDTGGVEDLGIFEFFFQTQEQIEIECTFFSFFFPIVVHKCSFVCILHVPCYSTPNKVNDRQSEKEGPPRYYPLDRIFHSTTTCALAIVQYIVYDTIHSTVELNLSYSVCSRSNFTRVGV